MGFWHTGYMEHHEQDFFAAASPRTLVPRQPPALPCPECGRSFLSREELELHSFEGHTFRRPLLLLRGRECGRSRLKITDPTTEADWEVVDCQRMTINGDESDALHVGRILSSLSDTIVSVVLSADRVEQQFDLEFAIADPSDLKSVDDQLARMMRRHQLTINSVESFLGTTEMFPTAAGYRAGIATYLYGVLARERSSESELDHDTYRERFDQAVRLLGDYDRPSADAICSLVAFHYNQFDRVAIRPHSPRVAWATRRLLRLLRGDLGLPDDEVVAPMPSGLEFALSDALTEQVLTWSCIPLDGSAAAAVADMESSLPTQEPFDRLKVRLVAAEHYLRVGLPERGRSHVDELRHNPIAETWARAYLTLGVRSGEVSERTS